MNTHKMIINKDIIQENSMKGEYLSLVESINEGLGDEKRLEPSEQQTLFKGWFIARINDDINYKKTNLQTIIEHFIDELAPVYGEESFDDLELSDYENAMKDIEQNMKPPEDVVDAPEEIDGSEEPQEEKPEDEEAVEEDLIEGESK
jgi:hypothetical protein